MAYHLGVDLGGASIVAAVVADDGEIIALETCKTDLPRSPGDLARSIAELCGRTAAGAGLDEQTLPCIGMGVPGIVEPESGVVLYSCHLGYENVPLAGLLAEQTGKRVFLENDANLAALGEFWFGAGKGSNTMISLTLGTGMGGGVIQNQKLVTGCNHAGGELGHMVIHRGGRLCHCGRHGCFEAYASVGGLIATTEEEMRRNRQSKLWRICPDVKKITGKTAFEAMRLGDETAKKIISRYSEDLACGIINLINIFQPDRICLGGEISGAGEALLSPLQAAIDQEDYASVCPVRTRLVVGKLQDKAGLIGASLFPDYNRRTFKPERV